MSDITLSDAIRNLRSELLTAMQSSADEPLRFVLGPIEMEFEVEVKRDDKVKGGIKWWLIEAGGEATQGRSATHKIKLTLDPVVGPNGERAKVSDTVNKRPD